MASNVGFSKGAVEHVAVEDTDNLLGIANLVIYGSCLDEQSFPSVLVQAMILEKLVIAPDLGMITKYVCHKTSHALLALLLSTQIPTTVHLS